MSLAEEAPGAPPILDRIRSALAGDPLAGRRFLTTAIDGTTRAGVYDRMTSGGLRAAPAPRAAAAAVAVLEDVLIDVDSADRATTDLTRVPGLLDEAIGRAHAEQIAEDVRQGLEDYHWSSVALVARALLQGCRRPSGVKLAIILLGVDHEAIARDDLFVAGHHEDLTRYCVAAIRSARPDAEEELLALARATRDEGRRVAVEALRGAAGDSTRRWLRAEGWRTTSYDGMAAVAAAEAGRLLAALSGRPTQEDLLVAVEHLGMASSDLTEYPDGMRAAALAFGRLDRSRVPAHLVDLVDGFAESIAACITRQTYGDAPQRWSGEDLDRASTALRPYTAGRTR